MAPQASKKCGLLPPDRQRIGSSTSNSIDSGKVPDTVFLLTISSISLQKLAQSKKWFLTPFLPPPPERAAREPPYA